MKFETLLLCYKNLGYIPKGLERDLEVSSIIQWIYEKYDMYIDVQYCHIKFPNKHKKFVGMNIWNTKEDYNNSHYCERYFKNPFDAKCDALRKAYKSIKSQFH